MSFSHVKAMANFRKVFELTVFLKSFGQFFITQKLHLYFLSYLFCVFTQNHQVTQVSLLLICVPGKRLSFPLSSTGISRYVQITRTFPSSSFSTSSLSVTWLPWKSQSEVINVTENNKTRTLQKDLQSSPKLLHVSYMTSCVFFLFNL